MCSINTGKRNIATDSPKSYAAIPGWVLPLALTVFTFLAFLPALGCGFVTWDDDINFLNNPAYRGLGLAHLRWMFTTFHTGPYQPLSWFTHGLDYVLWGMNPAGYHLTNVLLHSAAAALFFALSLRLLRLGFGETAKEGDLRWGAAFAALFFAVHPLRVESVAWITERRDVLSGVFYLASAIWYLRFAGASAAARFRPYLLALFFFAAALLSKATGIGMAFALLALDIYPLKRLPSSPGSWLSKEFRPVFLEKLPFLAMGLAAGVLGLIGQQQARNMSSLEIFGPAQRIAQAAYSLAFYIWKTLVPAGLLPVYPPQAAVSPLYVFGGAAVIVLGVLLFMFRSRLPGLVSAAIVYLVFLAPVMGLVKVGYHITADHYSYLACMGWAVAAGALLVRLQGAHVRRRSAARAAALAIAAVLAALTWRQTGHWRDSETLWRYVISAEPGIELAHNNLGVALKAAGRYDEAMEEFKKAVRLKPRYPDAVFNIGNTFLLQGRGRLARPYFEEALRLKPDLAQAYIGLGNILVQEGQPAAAVENYRKSLGLQPGSPVAHVNLAYALVLQGEYEEGGRAYLDALRLDPGLAEAYNGVGRVLLYYGRAAEAVPYFQRALRLKPDLATARSNLTLAEKALAGLSPTR